MAPWVIIAEIWRVWGSHYCPKQSSHPRTRQLHKHHRVCCDSTNPHLHMTIFVCSGEPTESTPRQEGKLSAECKENSESSLSDSETLTESNLIDSESKVFAESNTGIVKNYGDFKQTIHEILKHKICRF